MRSFSLSRILCPEFHIPALHALDQPHFQASRVRPRRLIKTTVSEKKPCYSLRRHLVFFGLCPSSPGLFGYRDRLFFSYLVLLVRFGLTSPFFPVEEGMSRSCYSCWCRAGVMNATPLSFLVCFVMILPLPSSSFLRYACYCLPFFLHCSPLEFIHHHHYHHNLNRSTYCASSARR